MSGSGSGGHLPPTGDSVVDAVTNYRGSIWIGLYGNNVDPTLVDGLITSAGGGSGGGAVHPLIEIPTGSVPGYMPAFPTDWQVDTSVPGLIALRGSATFRCSAAPAAAVKLYGWFAAISRQGTGPTLLTFAPLDPSQVFRRAGDVISLPVSILVSQPDATMEALVTADTEGVAFVTNLGKAVTGNLHTKSDVEFVRFLYRALKRVFDHDQRALAPRQGVTRTSPIPVLDPADKATATGHARLMNRLQALHQLWTGRQIN